VTPAPFTLLDDGRPVEVPADVRDDTVRLARAATAAALGVTLGSEVPDPVEIGRLAAVLDRPLALEPSSRVGYLGVSARVRGQALASLRAPDFTLPDLTGRLHTLREHRGKKVLLVAYASW
jgi:hypothetical protein